MPLLRSNQCIGPAVSGDEAHISVLAMEVADEARDLRTQGSACGFAKRAGERGSAESEVHIVFSELAEDAGELGAVHVWEAEVNAGDFEVVVEVEWSQWMEALLLDLGSKRELDVRRGRAAGRMSFLMFSWVMWENISREEADATVNFSCACCVGTAGIIHIISLDCVGAEYVEAD